MKHLLQDARSEILQLRRENELLRAKQEMVDLFATVLYSKPYAPSQGMGEDVAWKLERAITEIDASDVKGALTPLGAAKSDVQ